MQKVIYGMGSAGKQFVDGLILKNLNLENYVLVDKNADEIREYRKLKVYSPEVLLTNRFDKIIITTSWELFLEIKKFLSENYMIPDEQMEWFYNVFYLSDEEENFDKELLEDVYSFCREAQILRNGINCSDYYKGKYTVFDCQRAIDYLFTKRKMGAYYFEKDADPQKYMKNYILENVSEITTDSYILEIGPGDNPLFSENEYPNWYGIDANNKDGVICFGGKVWGGFYNKIYTGYWENISSVVEEKIEGRQFDLVCGSHSFEHCRKPISALKEAGKVLRKGGYLVLFVPDGFSTWPGNYDKTHTMYLTYEMFQELFEYADVFELLCCTQFRVNMDMVVVARKI